MLRSKIEKELSRITRIHIDRCLRAVRDGDPEPKPTLVEAIAYDCLGSDSDMRRAWLKNRNKLPPRVWREIEARFGWT